MTMEINPMKRSCPSERSVSRRNASRQARGAISGSNPSSTSTSAHAARSVPGTASPVRSLLAAGTWRALGAGAGLLEILEELGARIEHHDVALVPERRLVRLETAVEGIELGILTVRGGIDRRRLGVSVALGLLRLLVGVGQDHFALPIRVGTDLLRLGRALRAQLVGDALALRLHPLIDLRQHFLGQLDPAQAHVDDLDADLLGIGVGALPCRRHDLVALRRDRFVNGALVDLLGKIEADGLRQTLFSELLVAGD